MLEMEPTLYTSDFLYMHRWHVSSSIPKVGEYMKDTIKVHYYVLLLELMTGLWSDGEKICQITIIFLVDINGWHINATV